MTEEDSLEDFAASSFEVDFEASSWEVSMEDSSEMTMVASKVMVSQSFVGAVCVSVVGNESGRVPDKFEVDDDDVVDDVVGGFSPGSGGHCVVVFASNLARAGLFGADADE